MQQSLPNGETLYKLVVTAHDGGGLEATQAAEVYISVTGPGYNPPVFSRAMYRFNIAESVPPDTYVGAVQATYAGSSNGGFISHWLFVPLVWSQHTYGVLSYGLD